MPAGPTTPVCVGPTPAAEACNGADDNCDGAVDEGDVCGGDSDTDTDADGIQDTGEPGLGGVDVDRRKSTQPLGLPSCGSVFRNPPGDHAARLIETAGLKGRRVGGAEVSAKHANFIINRNRATATDIERLIEHVQRTVSDVHGVDLVHEVRIVGEAPA